MAEKKMAAIFIDGPVPPALIAESIGQHSRKTGIGGHSIFLGQVRADVIDGKTVAAIEYSAYEQMAMQKMQQIREAIFEKFPLHCLHVYHSRGLVKAGEICLFVFASAAHRKAAIDGCEETVERIKAELPVWGKELFADSGYQWKENR
jgi:molybdopterin synthase catalytic subunit